MIETLSRDNPRLKELEAAYSKLNLFDHSLWKTWADQIDITKFRGENAYLSQMWMMTEERYRNTAEYALTIVMSETALLLQAGDDDAFGCIAFDWSGTGRKFSRDLLDSVFECVFLVETMGFYADDTPLVYDIGAGYGRFAHRFRQCFPGSYMCCLDAVPLSTFLCEFYMNYRQVKNAAVLPLDQLDKYPYVNDKSTYGRFSAPTMAVNQYSFSEMPLSAVNFWLSFCADLNIPYFFLVPHAPDLVHSHFLTSEPDGSHQDYLPSFVHYGYKLERRRPKFPVEMSDSLIYNTEYWLFKRGKT